MFDTIVQKLVAPTRHALAAAYVALCKLNRVQFEAPWNDLHRRRC